MKDKKVIFRDQRNDDVTVIDVFGTDVKPYAMARASYGHGDETAEGDRLKSFLMMLMERGHFGPFEHCAITYKLTAPIFVFRQLFRHRTASISELSLRYSEAPMEFYLHPAIDNSFCNCIREAVNIYNELTQFCDIKKEDARAFLPVSLFSTAYFTMNMRNLFNLWDQRRSRHAQMETRFIAERMLQEARRHFPVIIRCYLDSRKEFEI